ncbi:hypothetical protein GCM10023156_23730 [Novipirellula rosea]|uniref:Uncharacterized protein n=1 Tax=Novipirellula rosea TaxID=1031540 RepID=A0ABP8MQY1_9BACT
MDNNPVAAEVGDRAVASGKNHFRNECSIIEADSSKPEVHLAASKLIELTGHTANDHRTVGALDDAAKQDLLLLPNILPRPCDLAIGGDPEGDPIPVMFSEDYTAAI